MKRTDNTTGYILLQAYTNSEYDTCDFVIVHVTQTWKNKMLQRLQLVAPFKNDDSFSHFVYAECPEGFYTYNEGETGRLLAERENWCFVELTTEELGGLPKVDNELCGYQLCIDSRGMASYKAYAEQSNGEFYTDDFNMAALVATANN